MTAELAAARRQQRRALSPQASVFVQASAGTGKTKVLVDRVLSLLLAGAAPERILCLTFTKAAAAEMANRLLQTLATWATLPAPALEQVLTDLLDRLPKPGEQADARRLFARVLDAPGGLRIQTIHGFCQSLLARFPLEAGVDPGFRIAEEGTAAELALAARGDLLELVAEAPDAALGRALTLLLEKHGDLGLDELCRTLVAQRQAIWRMLEDKGGLPGLFQRLEAALGIARDLTPEGLENELLAGLPLADIARMAGAFCKGAKTDQQRADCLQALLATAAEARAPLLPDYISVFLTKEGRPRSDRNRASQGAKAALPALIELLDAECARLVAHQERLAAIELLQRAMALGEVAQALLEFYQLRKQRAGLLDYGDLIDAAERLLSQPGRAAWVLYKLDGGLDHLLIDEAQDTSPQQWTLVKRLTEEFHAGESTRGEQQTRTIFAVGDAKQSIFRFQGADPAGFRAAQEHFSQRLQAARRAFQAVPLEHSFRSVPAVLDAVDRVFGRAAAAVGVVEPGQRLQHRPIRSGQGGLVELWPLFEPDPPPEKVAWSPPLRRQGAPSPAQRLADRLARTIHGWLNPQRPPQPGDAAWLESRGRPVRPGDVLILVQRRNAFFEMLARALKLAGVPVAGVDRMELPAQIAVEDLLALGRFLLLPEDDLTLAALLKSPLCGLDEEALFRLAWQRPGSLWAALGRRREEPPYAAAWGWLTGLLARADSVPPFELFAEVLGRGGRRALRARLGEETNDPLDELLGQALAWERQHPPSLQGFLAWLERSALTVKRDMETAAEAVRIMTVHGAKGLQAPIVFLPDTTRGVQLQERLLLTPDLLLPAVGASSPVTGARRLAEAMLAAEAEERRRLLYVALTRAEDRLYLCGWQTNREPSEDCWYAHMEAALGEGGEPIDLGDLGHGRRHGSPQELPPRAESSAAAGRALRLGAWRERPPPAEPSPPRPLTPSRPPGEEPAALSPLAGAAGQRFRRGLLVHRLLQALPELPPERRADAAARYLSAPGAGLTEPESAALTAEILAVLTLPEAAPLFAPGSRAEVPLAGLVGEERLAGRVDRLAVTPQSVLLVDYKTNRPPPALEAGVPALYLWQMACYRRLAQQVWPGRSVHCFLLWTDGPRLMQLSDDRLERALP